jgi:hypothetical protein
LGNLFFEFVFDGFELEAIHWVEENLSPQFQFIPIGRGFDR